MMDFVGKLFDRINNQDLPSSRDTVEECVLQTFFALLQVWISDGKFGAQEFAQEVDALFKALKNKQDPIVKSFNLLDRTAMFGAINTLTKQKEMMLNVQNALEENPTSPDATPGSDENRG